MTAPRFFIEGVHEAGERVALRPDDGRKATLVLRLTDGDPLAVFDSSGREFAATLERDGVRVLARLTAVRAEAPSPAIELTLAQALPRGAKMDFVVEKATELGVRRIVPVRAERSQSDPGPAKLERWRRLARTAAMQCGRADVPDVTTVATLADVASLASDGRLLVPWELAPVERSRDRLPPLCRGASRVALFIGPEGGLSGDEIDELVAAGAVTVSLGRRILRTETAGLVAIAALWCALGEM